MGNTSVTESFAKWHEDVTISNNHTTARNWHDWCYHRTCYGSTEIASDSDLILRWVIQVVDLSGYVCIGIDSIQQMDTWFYRNKNQANYGYESSGKMYECGHTNVSTAKYGSGDWVTMVLHTTSGLLAFYKKGKARSHSFTIRRIKPGSKSKYRLAISLKRAEVRIVDFSAHCDEFQKKYRNVVKQNQQLTQQLMIGQETKSNEEEEENEIHSLKNKLKTLTTKNDSFNELMDSTLNEIDRIKAANQIETEKSQQTISNLKRQINALQKENNTLQLIREVEEKNGGIGRVLSKLNTEFTAFKKEYNRKTLQNAMAETPEFVLNQQFNIYQENVNGIVECCKLFRKYIQDCDETIYGAFHPNLAKYKEWNVESMVIWLRSLENGRYIKYVEVLKRGCIESEINGKNIADLTRSDLTLPPFNIKNFEDKKGLETHFKSLKAPNIMENDEGAPTAYINQ